MWKIRENYYRSIALNTLNTIKMFITINRTSRFPTRDDVDRVGIHLQKSTRIIQNIIRIFLVLFLTFYSIPFWDKIRIFYKIFLNIWVLLTTFNEILIPQDSFKETTITYKRIRRRKFIFITNEIILISNTPNFFYY